MESETKLLKLISLPELTNWSVRYLLDFQFDYNKNFPLVSIGEFLTRNRNVINIENDEEYSRVTVRGNNNGVCLRDTEIGKNIGTKKQYVVSSGQFIISKIDARNGAMGIIPNDLDGAIVTNDFPTFFIEESRINPQFLLLITTTKTFINFAQSCSSGTTNRQRIDIAQFLNIKIPLPTLAEQDKIVARYEEKIRLADEQEAKAIKLESEIEKYLFKVLGIEKLEEKEGNKGLQFVSYSTLNRWDGKPAHDLKAKFPIVKIKNVIKKISTGTTPSTNRKEYFENGEVNFYTPADLTNKMYLTESGRKVTQLAIEDKKARKFYKNTLLFVGIGSTIGKVGIIENKYATSNQQITGLILDSLKVEVEFIYFYFHYFQHITTKEKTQATIPIVNQNKILEIPLPLPPLDVQNEIVDRIKQTKSEINELHLASEQNRLLAIQEFEEEIFETA